MVSTTWNQAQHPQNAMHAIVYRDYGSPDVLRLQAMAPPVPAANEVVIRVHAAAVSTTDCSLRQGGALMRLVFGLTRPRRPILGTEFAGEIAAVGEQVRRFQMGDRIYGATGAGFGAHAEYICLPEDGPIAAMPANVSYAEAAAISEGGMTALPFLRDKGQIQPGQRVLINGASGAVGSAAVQLAKIFGAHVTAVCGPDNQELVAALGADTVINYHQTDFTRSGETYEIIFDAVGKRTFADCQHALTRHGIYLGTAPTLPLLGNVLWTALRSGKKAKVAATGLRSAPEKVADLLTLKEFAEAGTFRPVIDGCYPKEQIAAAHRRVETGHKRGHVLVTLA